MTLLNTKQVAEMLGVVRGTVQDLAQHKLIPHYKIGNRLFFKKEEVEKWLEQKCRVQQKPVWPVQYRKRIA